MLEKIQRGLQAFTAGVTSGKAVIVLAKTYGLVLSHEESERVRLIGAQWEGEMSEHELAACFLINYINDASADPGDPKAKKAADFLMQQVKHQQAKGMIRKEWIVENLSQVVEARFGVNRS